ncbi:unnamed protein product [Orchesella dallaii]|uniref:Uncharacterized protein n=1 Tax=Orchesella dallaii TaxID=48710 RepID=A0ABP1QVW3_9HEXA
MPNVNNEIPKLTAFYDIPLQNYDDDRCPHIPEFHRRRLSTIYEEKDEERSNEYNLLLCEEIFNEEILEESANEELDTAKWTFPTQAPEEQYARCTPLVKLRNFNSEMYKNSPDHRGAIMWNEIPRDVDIQKLGVAQFLEQFKQGKYAKKK